jgi:MATE family multidrug resistance protein
MDSLAHHMRRTLALGLPLVGSQVGQVVIGATDTLMLGRYSVDALAAGVLGSSVFFTLFVVGVGFAYALTPVVAESVARGQEREARRATRMALWLAALFAAAMLPATWFSAPLMRALGQQEALAVDVEAYLRIAGLGLWPALIAATFRAHLSALERTRVVFWATTAAALANGGLNWLLIYGNWGLPEMGLRGAAVASVAVQVVTAAILLAYATRGPGMARFALLRNPLRADWPVLGRLFRLGWPIGATHLAESSLFTVSALMMGWLGTVPLAAHGIVLQIAAATFMVHLGLSSAATVRVGQARGRGEPGQLRRGAWAALLLSGMFAAAAVLLYMTAGPWLVGLFVDAAEPDRAAILAMGGLLLLLAAAFQFVDAAQVMALGLLRGLQDTTVPMLWAVLSYWVLGVPASYVLGFVLGWGPAGIWLGLVVGLTAAAATLMARFWRLAPRPAPVPASA